MVYGYKITAKKNGDFLLKGDGVNKVMQSGEVLTVKSRAGTIELTFITEETVSSEADSESPNKGGKCGYGSSNDAQQLAIAEWIEKYFQRKAEAAQKPEPKKVCGICRYTPEGIVDFNQIVLCEKRWRTVSASFDGCSYFEPRASETSEKSVTERLSTAIKSGIEATEVSSTIADDERIAQLEKENAELQSTNAHLRKELAWQFDQLAERVITLQDQSDRLREELDAAKKQRTMLASTGIKSMSGHCKESKTLSVKRVSVAGHRAPVFSCDLAWQ